MCKYPFWPFSSFFRQLENYYPGQLGSSDSCWLQNPLCGSTSSVATKSHDNQVQHSDEAHEHCYPHASRKDSNQGSSASQEPIYFLPIPSRESPIRRRISTNYQPEALKQICRRVVLQDGGSPGSPFVDTTIALELWSLVLKIGSWVTATHIPGILNVNADTASRQFNPRVEWTLDPSIFRKIVYRFYLPEVDLFASRLSH